MKDDIYKKYHDTVWGRPERDDQRLSAKLILDGAQAGLSWYAILIRSDSYAKAYHDWDAKKIARYGEKDIARLMNDPGIIRNHAKVMASIGNAQAYLQIMEGGKGSFRDFLWKHVAHKTIVNDRTGMGQLPASTPKAMP